MQRPFRESDFSCIPEGYRVRSPDYVAIGSPKSGTSWWDALLREHPQIVPHRIFCNSKAQATRELTFFPHFMYHGISDKEKIIYNSAFVSPKGAICGEWSTQYLGIPHCIEYLYKTCPNAKILVMLRNPVDRTVSHLNHLMLNRARIFGLSSEAEYVIKVLSAYPEAVLHSHYSYGLRRLLRFYDRNNILLLQYEKCLNDPEVELKRTYSFLNVDPNFCPDNLRQEVNKQRYVVPAISADERNVIADYFSYDVEALVSLFPEIDLSLWLDFKS